MNYIEARECIGQKVIYRDEEYVLLQIRRQKSENPFVPFVYEGVLYHPGRNAASFVMIEHLKGVPRELFRRRLRFGESKLEPDEIEKMKIEV